MEGVKACGALLMMAVVLVAFIAPISTGAKMGTEGTDRWLFGNTGSRCKGNTIGDFLGDEELGMDSEVSRRVLPGRGREDYLGYGALKPDMTPCKINGAPYSNCKKLAPKNPYNRGCTKGMRCRYGDQSRADN